MTSKCKIMLLQTRHIESISYLSSELLSAFLMDRYEITMVYLESGTPNETDCLAHECIFLGLSKLDYKGLRLNAIRKLKHFLSEHHYDVIIANMYKPINLLMQLRRSINASLCIGIIHGFGEFDRFGRRLAMRWMIDSRWKMVGVSQSLCDYLIQSKCGLDAHNTFAINNAIDVKSVVNNAYDRIHARKYLGLPQEGFVFGTVGRCVQDKRQMELLSAFHRLINQGSNALLIIMGDGELRPQLVSYVEQHQLHKKVFVVGSVPQAVKYLKALDVFVFPSAREGFGLALVEAMALSLPVIVNDIEPLNSIVAGNNEVVDAMNVELLSEKMNIFYQYSTDELNRIGAAHYQRVCNYYDIDQYHSAYRKLVENHVRVIN